MANAIAMDRYEVRRERLRKLVDEHFSGVTADFARATEIDATYVSRMLYPPGKNGRKRIGEDTVAKIEGKLSIHGYFDGDAELDAKPSKISPTETPLDYVRVLHLDAEASMGDGIENVDHPEVLRAIDFAPPYIRSLLGFVPSPGRLVLVTGKGDSMLPIIQPGETLLVDTGITAYDGDGLYLVNTGGGQQVKGLQHRGDAVYVVSANTALYPAFHMPEHAVIGGKVYLRNRIDRLG